ncbi:MULTISPECIES: alpha/beta fold hydrolase [Amycolatopsis]|uniref:Alpha/beta hydrolase n=1 Tax=Amycolatopsis thermalba TaxID=944492 RepID=A0ABY4NWG9_9PSEU|nr:MULTISPECIES: alpha/beta fold hydrolase [Amycolatopsis]OXM67509.1 alpha/beta hydrolase [Amycolatopsis sp. KNN50.9b]UQS24392.1 alpha/beta hydrolase [Amycolatopsis thermalba]
MIVILVPGFWLGASSWREVGPALTAAGHTVRALTLPGLESTGADRAGIGVREHVGAVIAAIDAEDEPVALVGHSGGGPLAYAAADARPDRVARIVFVDAGPLASGASINDALPAAGADVPLPDWTAFEEAELAGLTAELRDRMRAEAVPEPVGVAREPIELSDERRRAIPATVICTSMPAAQVRELIAADHPYVRELAAMRDAAPVDLPTGHWPQFSRPAELGARIVAALGS